MVVAGAGILGLCVAECASRRGGRVIVLDMGHSLQGSAAAAAQLGIKGQSIFRSAEFGLKIEGQRMYERWLQLWCGQHSPPSWFRRGMGRERFLNIEDGRRHLERICKHEQNPRWGWQGPSMVHEGRSGLSLMYVHEASVDAPLMLQSLRQCLLGRGVEFRTLDVRDVQAVLDLEPRSLVLAVGAWSEEVVPVWSDSADQIFTAGKVLGSSRLTLGATLDVSGFHGDLDLDSYVVEGVARPCSGERLSITDHQTHHSVTALSTFVHSVRPEQSDWHQLGIQQKRAEAMLSSFGLNPIDSFSLRSGLRFRATPRDLFCRPISLRSEIARRRSLRVILFTGANKSGYLYGPALAPTVVSLHDG